MSDSLISTPEPKKTIVFFEGDDDKAFLEKLVEAGLLPASWQLAKRDKEQHSGKDGLIRQLLPNISPVNGIPGKAVVLVDLDDLTLLQRVEWFRSAMTEALRKEQKYAGVTLQAAASIGPSTATIVGRLVKKGLETLGKEDFIALAKPFLDDLAAADKLVNA